MKILFLTTIVLGCWLTSFGQGFKGIVPLVSTCEDVKRSLSVTECNFPRSIYWLKDYIVDIAFTTKRPGPTDELCYKVPAGRVISFTVSYFHPFPIEDFEYKLKYETGPFGDNETVSYKNVEKGIGVLTAKGRVNTVIFVPSPKQHKKYAYECNRKKKNH